MSMRWGVGLLAGYLFVGGCGLHVPEIQENPFATDQERSQFIQEIVRNVRCEVQDAVVYLYNSQKDIDPYNRNLEWFDSWAAQISLTLTIDEKGTLNPVVSWLPTGHPSSPGSIFGLNFSPTLSSDATRTDKIGSFFTVAELKSLKACPAQDRHRGPFILESDLKLREWLTDTMISIDNGDTPAPANNSGPFKSNVLSHDVKFDIVSNASVTPSWKLTQYNVNTSGTFLALNRDRSQELSVVFGPVDPNWSEYVIDPKTNRPKIDQKTKKPILIARALAPAAQNAALAADIANALSAAFKNAQQ